MPRFTFYQVDVFTDTAFGGNPLAIFPDAEGLDSSAMQRIAREMNLSETTFVFRSGAADADYRVRIFTPQVELPFAGHPVVGTHWLLAHLGRTALTGPVTTVRFELGVGVRAAALHADAGRVTRVVMDHEPPRFGATASEAQVGRLERALRLPGGAIDRSAPARVVSTGIAQLFVPIARRADVERIVPSAIDAAALEALLAELDPESHCTSTVMVLTLDVAAPGIAVHTRMFAPGAGIAEDPATGSASGGLGAYLIEHALLDPTGPTTRFTSEQGVEMGRPSRIEIEVDGAPGRITMVRVGGRVVPLIEGSISW